MFLFNNEKAPAKNLFLFFNPPIHYQNNNIKILYYRGDFMSELKKILGQRVRSYRTNLGLSQEKLAELCGCHPTYIGQVERGEKNVTIESIDKIANSLNVSLSNLFENIGNVNTCERNIPQECYDFLLTKNIKEQEQIYKILIDMDEYKES